MVKILEKSGEDRQEERNLEIMLGIAKDMFGEECADKMFELGAIFVRGRDNVIENSSDPRIMVMYNAIYVYDSEYFENAVKLGEAYESRLSEEFEVHIEY